jgi:hypothetical protein
MFKFSPLFYVEFLFAATLFAPFAWFRSIKLVQLIPSFPRYWYVQSDHCCVCSVWNML